MRIFLLFILQLFSISLFASVWTVDNTGDSPSGTGSSGTLRYCVSQAVDGDDIIFNITGTAPFVITLTSDLIITAPINIDGATQPGFSSATGIPVISISGSASGYGFIFSSISNYAYVNSIHFNNQGGTAITLDGTGVINITGCYIGTDLSGNNYSSTLPPDTGIYVINGASVGQGSDNVILTPNGIIVNNPTSAINIRYNNIGLNRAGLNPGGSKRALKKGIEIVNSNINYIEWNNIGNCDTAAIIINNNSGNSISNNIIGKDLNSVAVPNGRGIWVKGNSNFITQNTIVNSALISGSSGIGIELTSGADYNNIYTNDVISCNAGGGIVLNGGNSNYSAPTFDGATSFIVYPDLTSTISGTCQPSDYVDIYEADNCGYGSQGRLLGTAFDDDDNGLWSAPIGTLTVGTKIIAIARSSNRTSPFSGAANLVAFDCKGVVKAMAGSNATSCSEVFYLNGSVVNAAGGTWSSSGTGTFSLGNNDLSTSANYSASIQDIAAGSVKITLTTTNAIGGCPDTSSSFILSLPIPKAVTFGGNSYYVYACPNAAGIPLDGKLINTTGGTWSTTGAGTFAAPANSLNNTYIPDASELLPGGYAFFTLTPDQPGACPPVNGNFQMYFSNTDPVADAGNDISACMNNPKVQLNVNPGFPYNSVTELWTNKGVPIKDSTYENDGSISRYFLPTPADLSSGSVTLIYKVSSPGCVSDQDTLKINYVAPPVVFAGDSSAICGNATSFSLSKATVSNNPGGTVQWSGFASGGPKLHKLNATTTDGNGFNNFSGTFEYDTLVNTIYYPSPTDRTSLDGVVLILTAETAGKECSVSSYFPVTFAPVPDMVDAGADMTLCQGDSASLSGLVSPGFPHNWTSAGTGKFLPVKDSLEAVYVPSKTDLKKVAFNLILNAGFPGCIVKDELLLILLPKPEVGVGYSQTICPNSEVTLTAAGAGVDQEGLWKVKKGTGEIPDSTNNITQITNITADTNIYVWTIKDNTTGCRNSAVYTVSYCYFPPLKVYNALSPNGDELGEFLEIEHIENYTNNKVSVFNRWGEMVFKMDNYTNYKRQEGGPYDFSTGNAFTGRSNIGTAQDLPNGSYYYVIDKGTAGGKPEKGFLVIQK